VWGTKNHERILNKNLRTQLLEQIRMNAKEKQIYIDSVNGDMDHIHCLLVLNADMSVSKAIQLIKGESAHWTNKNSLNKQKFEWADEYFAVSASESILNKVRDYIRNQEKHHKRMSFKEEFDKFMISYNFDYHG
jgi:REP element-mobilizing transposase RayT